MKVNPFTERHSGIQMLFFCGNWSSDAVQLLRHLACTHENKVVGYYWKLAGLRESVLVADRAGGIRGSIGPENWR